MSDRTNSCNCPQISFRHYTTREGASAIQNSGVIKQSPTGLGGPGVYGTTMGPSNPPGAILWNNYDGSISKESNPSNVQCHVKVCMKSNEVHKVPNPDGRNVLLHKGDIKLSGRDYEVVCKK